MADVLFQISNCGWRLAGDSQAPVDLVAKYPDETRPLLEDCLRDREVLPTVFNYGGSRDRQVLAYVVQVLARIGDGNTAQLLSTVMDDPELGRHSISAIESIRQRGPVTAVEAVTLQTRLTLT